MPPATFDDMARGGFRLTPYCRHCWRRGETITPAEAAAGAGVPMSAATVDVARRLVCSGCGSRQSYYHLENPHVRPHT
jgi:hypothetical protein